MRAVPILLDIHADIYQAHDLEALIQATYTAKFLKKPLIYDAHELASDTGIPNNSANYYFKILEGKLFPQVDYFILPNRFRAEIYKSEYKLKSNPVVIKNCAPYVDYPQSNRLKSELKLPKNLRVVLYHGTFMSHRCLENLLRSASEFSDNIILVMMGDQNDYYRQTLKPIWMSMGLEKKVYFLPYVSQSEVMTYVSSADLGVVIYRNINRNNYFCAPTKLYEFIMAQVPVAACGFPEIMDILDQYPLGVVFDPEDPSSIAAAINDFFSTLDSKKKEYDQWFEAVRHRFNWENEARHYLDLLHTVLKEPACIHENFLSHPE